MSRIRSPYMIAAIALVVALVAAALALSDGGEETPEASDQTSAVAASDDPLAKGSADAPVVMIAYSDFQCPFCGKFARDTEPELDRYIEDGTLRVEWRDFAYMGEDSTSAALAARAAGEQGKFWEFHEALFDEQPERPNTGAMDDEMLRTAATKAGVDLDRWEQDRGDEQLAEEVEADFRKGVDAGVTGTPTFLINDRPLVGAQPLKVFEQAIEDAAGR